MKKLLSYLFPVLVLCSCLGRGAVVNQQDTPAVPAQIKIPAIPSVMVTDEEKAEYLVLHYWDNFDFTDTLYVDRPEITEQAFADYLAVAGLVPREVADRSIHNIIEKSALTKPVYYYFTELFEKYLDDPNSPFRNEELYIVVLENITESAKVDDLDKIRPRAQLASALKNRVGTRAADITVTDAAGRKISLYGINTDYTLLYFNNPDCNYCEEVTASLKGSTDLVMPLVRQGVLTILAVYPDEDLTAWRDHLDDMPSEWLRTYDGNLSIRNGQLYDLRAIPSLYLLSRDKTVILKDIDKVFILENYFARMGY